MEEATAKADDTALAMRLTDLSLTSQSAAQVNESTALFKDAKDFDPAYVYQ
jgi:hypothetical protein